MDWRARYLQQAAWTRDLRAYIFDKAGLARAQRILEVGCGTGAILSQLPAENSAARFGLDLDINALAACRISAPGAFLLRADAHDIPFPARSFDIACCHYLLLWTRDPLRVVKEMARVSRVVIAFAEPDYGRRVDEPDELKPLGALQNESLRRQGANPFFGATLAETFFRAGIRIEEAGEISPQENPRFSAGQDDEWPTLESDLRHVAAPEEILQMRALDEEAYRQGRRRLRVPTFFAWGFSGEL